MKRVFFGTLVRLALGRFFLKGYFSMYIGRYYLEQLQGLFCSPFFGVKLQHDLEPVEADRDLDLDLVTDGVFPRLLHLFLQIIICMSTYELW